MRSSSGFGLALAAFAFVVSVLLAAAALLQFFPRWRTPDAVPAPAVLPTVGGAGLIPLLLGAITLLLVGVFVLLLLLVMCSCCRKASLPFPVPPDLSKLAGILRDVSAKMKTTAGAIDTANAIVDPAREKLTSVTSFKISKPKFKSIGHIEVLGFSGEAWVPDGNEEWSPFDDEAARKLKAFADDATGKTALAGASTTLRDQAVILEQQASALEGQS